VKADGRTPYERLRGREYRGEIAEWAETVHCKVATAEKGKLDPQSARRASDWNRAGHPKMQNHLEEAGKQALGQEAV